MTEGNNAVISIAETCFNGYMAGVITPFGREAPLRSGSGGMNFIQALLRNSGT